VVGRCGETMKGGKEDGKEGDEEEGGMEGKRLGGGKEGAGRAGGGGGDWGVKIEKREEGVGGGVESGGVRARWMRKKLAKREGRVVRSMVEGVRRGRVGM